MSAIQVSDAEYQKQLSTNRLGLWLFFFSEGFMFAGLLVARFYLWGDTRPDLNQTLGLIVTAILLISSYFMNRAEVMIAHDDRDGMLSSLIITAVLGLVFLIGVVGFEWQGHIRPTDGAFGAVLYGMTGMHALHVLSGIAFIFVVWRNGRKGCYSKDRHWGVHACAVYWHYVDLVWVFFYPALYLMGTAQ
ncbi:MAG: heme-copper oxidase subunit III [Chloroflexi bacterium]|nr:heme-copper oxidase subunit III [Chloroflexota bacterium]